MSRSNHGPENSRDQTTPSDQRVIELIDAACDRFEEEWEPGQHPRIENVLARMESHLRPALFAALLPVEIELRLKVGELPDAAEYRRRFPDFDAIISKAFQQRDGMSQTNDRTSPHLMSAESSVPKQDATSGVKSSHSTPPQSGSMPNAT